MIQAKMNPHSTPHPFPQMDWKNENMIKSNINQFWLVSSKIKFDMKMPLSGASLLTETGCTWNLSFASSLSYWFADATIWERSHLNLSFINQQNIYLFIYLFLSSQRSLGSLHVRSDDLRCVSHCADFQFLSLNRPYSCWWNAFWMNRNPSGFIHWQKQFCFVFCFF